MVMANHLNKRGFTIIEVVLVLAIAGLIFLMVFVALPALQRNQRNTQRRSDASRVVSAIVAYQKNNGGKVPVSGEDYDTNFVPRYIDKECKFKAKHEGAANFGYYTYTDCGAAFTAPDGNIYEIAFLRSGSNVHNFSDFMSNPNSTDFHTIFITNKTRCSDEEGGRIGTGKSNDFIVVIPLEGGSMYCADNS